MNIVYLHSHDTGRWIEPYGHPHPTPNFTRLATDGVLFEDAHTPSPTCSPSRACLLTGQMPRKNGMIGLAHRGARLRDPSRHLASLLRDLGYATALSGVQHEFKGTAEADMPYDEVLAEPGVDDVADADPAIADAASDYLRREHDKPFFLACGLFTTHRTAGRTDQRFNAEASPLGNPVDVIVPPDLPDLPEVRQDIADYNVALDRLDECVGRVLDAVDFESTLLICTTDHGVPFPNYKSRLTPGGTGVLLMLRGPGIGGGRRTGATVTHLDVVPTVLHLLGQEMPDDLDGRSLLPLLRGEVDRLHDATFGEVNFHAAAEPMRSVRVGDYLYIRHFGKLARRVLPNCDPGPTRQAMIERGWADNPPPAESLYDLVNDPYCLRNVLNDESFESVAADFRERLAARMARTNDPLRHGGDLPLPDDLVLTPMEATYPADTRKV
ncbi:MAG: sulfatase [Planctomycetota bacterium]